jgi:glycosyltransferase involved in cell wall biosynthesis
MQPQLLDIVVPVLNEEASIDEFIARVERLGYAEALIFVDNASNDGTVDRIQRHPGCRLIRHARNEGYGASIRHGIEAGAGEVVVIVDADLEYPVESIPALLDSLSEHPVAYASRFLGPRPPEMPLARRLGNLLMTRLYNLLYRQRVTDLCTGMKAFRREAFPAAALTRDGFEHCIEFAVLSALLRHRIHEIAVDYHPRQKGVSKMQHIPEALKFCIYLLANRMPSRRRLMAERAESARLTASPLPR